MQASVKKAWDLLLTAEMNVRYWEKMSRKYDKREKNAKIFLAVMSSGTVAAWGVWEHNDYFWKILSGVSAVIAVALPILNWTKTIEAMVNAKHEWEKISTDYDMLWLTLFEEPVKVKLTAELSKIRGKENRVRQKETILPCDKKLLDESYDEVLESPPYETEKGRSQKNGR